MENYNWNTSFDTANNLMIHSFGANIKVVTNLKTKEVKVYKNEDVTRTLDCEMSCTAYSNFLLSVAKDTQRLEEFNK